MKPQTRLILAHLRSGHSLTPLQALRKGMGFRLSARIWEIRQAGIPVEGKRHRDGYCVYRL